MLAQVNTINHYEYWIDSDYDNRVSVNIANPDTAFNLNETISLTGYPTGFHILNLRFKDSKGVWSYPLAYTFYKYSGVNNKIVYYEYWIDDDFQNRVSASLTPSDSFNLIAEIPIQDLSNGFHTFSLRFRDLADVWTSLQTVAFYKFSANENNKIVEYEYWFDGDYFNKKVGFVEPIRKYNLITNIPIDNLSKGIHSFQIRFKDIADGWSYIVKENFFKLSSGFDNSVTLYRYWFDNNDEDITTVELTTPTQMLELLRDLIVPEFEPNSVHIFNMQYQDKIGYWSHVTRDTFRYETGLVTLDAPDLILPTNNLLNVPLYPIFRWTASNAQDNYILQIATDAEFLNIAQENFVTDSNFVLRNSLATSTLYYWRVRAKCNEFLSDWSDVRTFTTTDELYLETPELIIPVANAEEVPVHLMFRWTSVPGGITYSLQIATDSSFGDIVLNELELTNNYFQNAAPFDYWTKYYWRVNAVNGPYSSDWSEVRTFKTINVPISAPNLISPAIAAVLTTPVVNFSWAGDEFTEYYRLQVSPSSYFSTPVINIVTNETSYQTNELIPNTQYYWRVIGYASENNYATSSVWNFITSLPQVVLNAPANNSTCIPIRPTLTWGAIPGQQNYQLEIATDLEFTNILYTANPTSNTHQIPLSSVLDNFSQYYWRVCAVRGGNYGAWSEIFTFKTSSDKPELLSPINLATSQNVELTLDWDDLTNVEQYLVQLSTNSNFSNILILNDYVAESSIFVDELNVNTYYYWRVAAVEEDCQGPWSSVFRFRTTAVIGFNYTTNWNQHNFGDTEIGDSKQYPFNITNEGTLPITLNSVTFASVNFHFLNAVEFPVTLQIGESFLNPVVFEPLFIQPYTETFTVNFEQYGDFVWNVSGNGYIESIPPVLSFVENELYLGTRGVYPQTGPVNEIFDYQVVYSDEDNNMPYSGYPKVLIDFNGNGNFNDAEDMEETMYELDPNEQDYVTGKVYTFSTNYVIERTMGYKFIAKDSTGNWATGAATAYKSGPTISNNFLDLLLYANDITFSKINPYVGEQITISAKIRNISDYPANNFNVRFYNDEILIGETFINVLNPNSNINLEVNYAFDEEGFYPIKVFIDEDNALGEQNRINNFATRPVIAGNYNPPGGITVTTNINPRVTPGGYPRKVSYSGYAEYYDVFDPETKVSGAEVTATCIETGQTKICYTNANGYFSTMFDAPFTMGTYHIEGVITDFTLIEDIAVDTFIVWRDTVAPPTPKPDLWVSLSRTSYDCAIINEELDYRLIYGNAGDETAYDVFMHVLAEYGTIYSIAFDSIPPGKKDTLFFNYSFAQTGTYPVYAQIDPLGMISEYYKQNNNSTLNQKIFGPLPDLIPIFYSWPSNYPNPYPSKQYNFVFRFSNLSCPPSPATFAIIEDIQDGIVLQIDTIFVPAVPSNYPGNSYRQATLNNFAFTTTGWHTLRITVNPDYDFDELDFSNNVATKQFLVNEAKADLDIKEFLISDYNPIYPGGNVQFIARIKNIGTIAAEDFAVRYYIGYEMLGDSIIVSSLGPGETIDVYSPIWEVLDCGHRLDIKVDEYNKILEYNKTNNFFNKMIGKEFDIYFRGPYGSLVKHLTISKPIGSVADINPVALNRGRFDAYNVPVAFGTPIFSMRNVDYFQHDNGAVNLSVPFNCDEIGSFVIPVNIDMDENGNSNTCEIDEDNNTAWLTINVYQSDTVNYPDLLVHSEHINPSNLNPDPNEEIDLYTSFKNIGESAAVNFSVDFYMNSEHQGDRVIYPNLGVNQQTSVGCNSPWSSNQIGAHIVRVKLNEDGAILESNYLNNEASRAVIVGSAPDYKFASYDNNSNNEIRGLLFEDLEYPYTINVGNAYQITAKIINGGRTNATSTVQFILITDDGESIIESVDINTAPNEELSLSISWLASSHFGQIKCAIVNSYPQDYNILNNETSFEFGKRFEEDLNVTVTASSFTLNPGETVNLSAEATGGSGIYTYNWTSNPPIFSSNVQYLNAELYQTTVFYFELNDLYTSVYDTLTITVIIESLDAPILISPANNITGIQNKPTLEWSSVLGATHYTMQVASDENFTNIVAEHNVSTTSKQLSALSYLTQYFWRVRAVAGTDDPVLSSWSQVWNFTTEELLISAPLLSLPADNATNVSINPLFVWNYATNANRYYLQVALDENFNNIVIQQNNLQTMTYNAANLQYLTSYYWRVNASNGAFVSNWSEVRTFTTIGVPVAPPVLISPNNNSVMQSMNVQFVWSGGVNTNYYRLQISTTGYFSNPLVNVLLYDTTYSTSDLASNTQYFWRVVGFDNEVNYATSITRTFYTPLSQITLLSPENNSTCVSLLPKFQWGATSGLQQYQFQLASDENFSSIIHSKNLTNSQYNLPMSVELANFTQYFWRVRTYRGSAYGLWSDVLAFTTSVNSPTLLSPLNNSNYQNIELALKWNPLPNVPQYSLQVCTNANFFGTLLINAIVSDTSYGLAGLLLSTNYYWRVAGVLDDCVGEWSSTFKFKTTPIVGVNFTTNWNQWNFGNVALGATAQKQFILTNAGTEPVVITNISFASTNFHLLNQVEYPYIVAPNTAFSNYIVFEPQAIQPFNEAFTISIEGLTDFDYTVIGNGYVVSTPPVLSFIQDENYEGERGVNPQYGPTNSFFEYKITYSDADNNRPYYGYPKVLIDVNGDGNFNGTSDIEIEMSESDLSDNNFIDGKEYTFSFNFGNEGVKGYKFIAKDSTGNWATGSPTNYKQGPTVSNNLLDLCIYANDITFSKMHPIVGEQITISARVRNLSDYPASNVSVRFYQEDSLIADVVIPNIAGVNIQNTHIQTVSIVHTFAQDEFFPIKVFIDEANVLGEQNRINNFANRPVLVGNYVIPGGIEVVTNINPRVSPGCWPHTVSYSGQANYYDVFDPDTKVAGAEVRATLVETGESKVFYTNANGHFSTFFYTPCTMQTYHIVGEITDFTLISDIPVDTFVVWREEIVVPPPPPPKPDLWTTVQRVGDGCIVIDEENVYRVIYGNRDTIKAEDVYFIVKEDNNIIYEMMFDTIPREYRDTLYFNITFNSVGIHAVSSYIDPNNLIDESKPYDNRKSNNHKILEIPVYPDLPDLSINTSPWGWGFAYPNPYPGKAYSLPVRVHNISCPNSPPNYLVYTTYKDGELVRRDTVIVPAINGLHWVDVHLNNYIFNETGIYTIYIDVNPDESFAEITYENNHIVRNVEVFEAKADLSLYHPIYGVYFDISNTNPAYPGGNLTFYQKIWNFGVVPAENFAVRFYIDNIQVGDSVIVPLLNPGGNYVVSSPTWVVEDCGHEYKIIVDGMNKIKEYSKENNSYDKVIGKEFNVYFMGPYGFTKNLVVDVPIGTTYKIKPYFLNYGTFDAYNIPTYFAAPIYSRPNISYFKNKNGCVSFTEYYQSDVVDTVVVYVYVDKDENGNSTVCEIDDDNNWAKVTIRFYEPSTVTYYPDLEVFSHHINPSELNPDPGEAIDIYTSFKNRGRAPAENFPINFYVNSIQQGETVMFPYIGVYQESSAAATEPWSSEMIGAHIIRVKLNEDTTIIETDYLNNQASRAIIVGSAPDYLFSGYNNNSNDEIRGLYIDNHTYPYNLNIGEAYNIVAKVANNGRADATATVMFYLIEGEEQTLIDAIDISTTPNEAKTVITTWVATTRYGKIKCVIDNTYPQDYNILNNETYFDFGTLFEEELAVEVSASSYLLLAGESVTLNAEATGGAELYGYEWFATPGGYTTSLANFQIQLYETTTFFFEVTDFYTTLYDTLTIEVVGEITPPILVAPLNNSINLVLNPLLDWNEVSTATSYSLQVATDNQFDNLIVDLNNLLLTNYQLENLNYLTQYFWRVKAVKQEPIYIESEWSEIWNFTTKSEEAPVQTISLINGWNLISSYIEPENPNIATIFSQINNLKIVKNPMGLIYDPTFGINQIGNWNMQHGYLVNVIGATSIDIIGEYIIPENTPINMISGWNTNSYLRTSPMAAPIALATIVPNLIIAKNGTGQIYHPAFGINTIGNLMPGKGYMFYMNSPSILTYPENSQKKGQDLAILTPSATNLIPVYSNTGNDATLFLFVDGKTQNCEVGVYNSNSELIGSGAIYNGVAAVTIWGDDDITTDIDGAIDNEQLIVKLFNTSKNEEIALTLNNIVDITTNTELNELTYKSNAIYTAKTTISSEGDLILSIRNTPNPFSTSTTFEYTVLNDSDVEILIYTTTGEQVAQVANSFHKAGRYSFVFESKDLANGVYQVILRSGNQRAMTMMIVEK